MVNFASGTGLAANQEDAQMSEHYILDGKKAIPVDWETWLQWCINKKIEGIDYKRVALTEKGDVRVSTVFLGLNHQWGEGPPLLYETMIFGGEHDQYQDRCTTWEEAELMHENACQLAGIEYARAK